MTLNKPFVVLDTSIFISAYLSSNPESLPNKIISLWQQGDFLLIVTPQPSIITMERFFTEINKS